MKRDIDMNEVSDGRLYGVNDMVKADCNDCRGCSDCCRGMGNSIVLDPYDVYRLTHCLNMNFEELLAGKLELNLADGLILPNLKMDGPEEACSFLNSQGRCSIHPYRPGICRIFPLGRIYEKNSFRYFLQIHECRNTSRSKVKVKKWIDTPDLQKNEKFIVSWHYFLETIRAAIGLGQDAGWLKTINMYLLQNFYIKPYDTAKDFYQQFDERYREAEKLVAGMMK